MIEEFFLPNRRAKLQLSADSLAPPLFPCLDEPWQRFSIHSAEQKKWTGSGMMT